MIGSPTHQNEAKPTVLRSVMRAGAAGQVAGADVVVLGTGGAVDALQRRDRKAGLIFAEVSADESQIDAELDVVMPGAPDGIAVAFTDGGSLALLGARIAAREAINGLPDGGTRIMAIISSGLALMQIGTLGDAGARLVALGWDAAALAADIGAATAWENGALIEPLAVARSLCLASAAAAGVPAIDTAMAAGAGTADFVADAERARRHGFRGKFARTADEVRILNEIFG